MLVNMDFDIRAVLKILEAPHALVTYNITGLPKALALKLTFLANAVSERIQKHFLVG